jgi:hypothetical protein
MKNDVYFLQLDKLDDLVRMMASSMRAPPIHHTKVKGEHVYFIPASMGLGKSIVYFFKSNEEIKERYVVLDAVNDKISFSDELSTKPTLQHFPVISVKTQNLLPQDL